MGSICSHLHSTMLPQISHLRCLTHLTTLPALPSLHPLGLLALDCSYLLCLPLHAALSFVSSPFINPS